MVYLNSTSPLHFTSPNAKYLTKALLWSSVKIGIADLLTYKIRVMENERFVISYKVNASKNGGMSYELHLTMSRYPMQVNGIGKINSDSQPFFEPVVSQISGNYLFSIEKEKHHAVHISANGFPMIEWPAYENGQVLETLPNASIELFLEQNWKKGFANISVQESDGNWIHVKNAEVTCMKEVAFVA